MFQPWDLRGGARRYQYWSLSELTPIIWQCYDATKWHPPTHLISNAMPDPVNDSCSIRFSNGRWVTSNNEWDVYKVKFFTEILLYEQYSFTTQIFSPRNIKRVVTFHKWLSFPNPFTANSMYGICHTNPKMFIFSSAESFSHIHTITAEIVSWRN